MAETIYNSVEVELNSVELHQVKSVIVKTICDICGLGCVCSHRLTTLTWFYDNQLCAAVFHHFLHHYKLLWAISESNFVTLVNTVCCAIAVSVHYTLAGFDGVGDLF